MRRAVRGIKRLATEGGDTCGHQRKKSLYLASRRRDAGILEEEGEARRRIGIQVAFLTERDIRERFCFKQPAALLSQLAGEVEPGSHHPGNPGRQATRHQP